MQAAKNIADLTALNMGAMAAQNRVLETNPTKQKIAGKYFRQQNGIMFEGRVT